MLGPSSAEPNSSAGTTPAARRSVVVVATLAVGAPLLFWGLTAPSASASFYIATFSLAAVWTLGAWRAEPIRRGHDPLRWVLIGAAAGLGLAAVFVVGALIVNHIEVLAQRVDDVLDFARRGSLPLVVASTAVNGVAEELFFRGPLYSSLPLRWQIVGSTVIYAVVTMATGNVMLGFAAVLLGALCALLRRWSGGVLAPVSAHLVWGLAMLGLLPLVIG